jgi:hypothetical protein
MVRLAEHLYALSLPCSEIRSRFLMVKFNMADLAIQKTDKNYVLKKT